MANLQKLLQRPKRSPLFSLHCCGFGSQNMQVGVSLGILGVIVNIRWMKQENLILKTCDCLLYMYVCTTQLLFSCFDFKGIQFVWTDQVSIHIYRVSIWSIIWVTETLLSKRTKPQEDLYVDFFYAYWLAKSTIAELKHTCLVALEQSFVILDEVLALPLSRTWTLMRSLI
jgi:hypothetical protein